MQQSLSVLVLPPQQEYELIDSGDGEKLERFGAHVLRRPDPQALWRKRLTDIEWGKADATFTREKEAGAWRMKEGMDKKWKIGFGDLKMFIKPTAFKHTGLFPEQSLNWDWLRMHTKKAATTRKIEVLNLFGYTGGASLALAQVGAQVVHVDSSKAAVTWARENADASGLGDKPVRWIIEDARLFVERELRRGRRYDGILLDPPAFGHGPSNELWKIEEHFLSLIDLCFELLSDNPVFFLINGYSAGYSSLTYANSLKALVSKYGGTLETGELAIEESSAGDTRDSTERLLPSGIFSRWSK